MAWWKRLLRGKARPDLDGQEYRVVNNLYSSDGKRGVEVRKFRRGETYLLEQEWVEGTVFRDLHDGRLVGPFASPEAAEKFIVATAWFTGREA